MEFRNVLLAIVLSTVVLIGWATFFEAPIVEQQATEETTTKNEDLSSPSIDEGEKKIENEITRNDVINNTKRVNIENENIKGSISLEGAIIDDILFCASSEEQMLERLKLCFDKLQKFNMKVRMDKCFFFMTEVSFNCAEVKKKTISKKNEHYSNPKE